jgi:hypothetical protein
VMSISISLSGSSETCRTFKTRFFLLLFIPCTIQTLQNKKNERNVSSLRIFFENNGMTWACQIWQPQFCICCSSPLQYAYFSCGFTLMFVSQIIWSLWSVCRMYTAFTFLHFVAVEWFLCWFSVSILLKKLTSANLFFMV